MIQSEIIENNSLIIDFMEIKETQSSFDNYGHQDPIWYTTNGLFRSNTCSKPQLSFSHFLNESKYHSSWEWLVPVLEKICHLEIGDDIIYVKYAYPRTFGMVNEETGQIMIRLNGFQLFQADILIEATYLAVVDFIQWYNERGNN